VSSGVVGQPAAYFAANRTKDHDTMRLEKSRVSPETVWPDSIRGEDHGGQVTKGVWGMSWRQKAMKGVEGCEKPGEAVKQALIPGYPNVVH
jgi:hypothetical protein